MDYSPFKTWFIQTRTVAMGDTWPVASLVGDLRFRSPQASSRPIFWPLSARRTNCAWDGTNSSVAFHGLASRSSGVARRKKKKKKKNKETPPPPKKKKRGGGGGGKTKNKKHVLLPQGWSSPQNKAQELGESGPRCESTHCNIFGDLL